MSEFVIAPVAPRTVEAAVDLLNRFFQEEGFAVDRATIAANLSALMDDPWHWAAIAQEPDGRPIGVITVSTMLYIEWGRLGEIGDLYVAPDARGRGVARALVDAALVRCRDFACSAVLVTTTPEGEAAQGLSRFYCKLGFAPTGRSSAVLHLR